MFSHCVHESYMDKAILKFNVNLKIFFLRILYFLNLQNFIKLESILRVLEIATEK